MCRVPVTRLLMQGLEVGQEQLKYRIQEARKSTAGNTGPGSIAYLKYQNKGKGQGR